MTPAPDSVMLAELLGLNAALRALDSAEACRDALLTRLAARAEIARARFEANPTDATHDRDDRALPLRAQSHPGEVLHLTIADPTAFSRFEPALREMLAMLADRLDAIEGRAALFERERLSNVIDGSRIGSWEWNVATGEVRINQRWAEILGYQLAELAPISIKTWETLAHPDDLQRSAEALAAHFDGRRDYYEIEARMRHRDGHWVWVLDRGRLITRTADGEPEWISGSHTDITQRKQTELASAETQTESERLLVEAEQSRRALISILEDHRHITEALQESESGLREAQRLAHIGSWQLDLVSERLDWSDEVFRIFEIAPEDFHHGLDDFLARVHPNDRDAVRNVFEQSLVSGEEYSIVHRLLMDDGRIKHVHERAKTQYDDDGRPLRALGTAQDVTERTRAELALREINERIRLAGQLAYDIIYEWDPVSGKLFWYGNVDRLLGFPEGTIGDETGDWLALIHPDDRARVEAEIHRHREDATAIDLDYRIRNADGTYRYWNDRALALMTDDGHPVAWVGVCSDITERHGAERALKRSEERYRGVVEDTPILICRYHADGELEFVNRAYAEYFGREPDALVGTNFLDLIPVDDRAQVLGALNGLTRDAPTLIREHRVVSADGEIRWQRWTDRALFDADGQLTSFQSIGEDITEAKRHQAYTELQARRSGAMLALPRFAEQDDADALLDAALNHTRSLTGSRGAVWYTTQDGMTFTPWRVNGAVPSDDALQAAVATITRERTPWMTNTPDDAAPVPVRVCGTPIVEGNTIVAVVIVTDKRSPYDDTDLETLQLLAAETWRLLQRRRATDALEASESRYRNLVDRMSDGVAVYFPTGSPGDADFAADFEIREFNSAAERITGATREQLLGMRVTEAFPGVAALGLIELMRDVARDGESRSLSESVYDDGKQRLWVENYVFRLPTGEVVAVFADITARKEAEERRRLADRVFRDTIEGVMITDRDANIVSVNPAFTQITGYEADEVIGHNPRILSSGRQDGTFYRALWAQLAADGHWRGELWNRRKNGDVYPEWITISRVNDDAGETTHFVGVFSDITNLKAAEARVKFMAQHDPLTSLPNRNLFLDRLQHAITRAKREQRTLSVMFIDLDRFKVVNDSLGHPVGDELLITVSQRMQSALRADDTLARVGGDEFLVLLEDGAAQDQVSVVARKLLNVMLRPMEIGGHSISVSASIGISSYPADGDDHDLLMRHADRAMYEAKRMGRNTFRFFTPELSAGATELLLLENDLRVARRQGQLELHYQPQFDINDGRLIGAEALLRWKHPRLGYVPPAEFIPLAEDIGIIQELGAWVLHEALRQVRAWDQGGLSLPTISVNLSTRQINRSSLVDWIGEELLAAGMAAERLELEVTESQLMRDPETSRATMIDLQNMGVHVAIDDFGTGYSSLAYLKMLRLDHLKIDKSFVQDVTEDADAEAIVRATIALADSLRLKTIAEGVETEEQAEFLRRNGADLAQGYLFGRPMAADAFFHCYHERPETHRTRRDHA